MLGTRPVCLANRGHALLRGEICRILTGVAVMSVARPPENPSNHAQKHQWPEHQQPCHLTTAPDPCLNSTFQKPTPNNASQQPTPRPRAEVQGPRDQQLGSRCTILGPRNLDLGSCDNRTPCCRRGSAEQTSRTSYHGRPNENIPAIFVTGKHVSHLHQIGGGGVLVAYL
jgi:hypothetical protein